MSKLNFERKNLSSRVAEFIREQIIFMEKYKEGERILEAQIAEELDVSRAPVREALRELENQGLIRSVPRKGNFVVKLTEEDMEEILDIRVILEGRIVEALIKQDKLTEEDFQYLESIVDDMLEAAKSSDNQSIIDLNKNDIKFHKYLWKKSGRKWTEKILYNLYYQLQLAMINDLRLEDDLKESAKKHYEILSFLREQNLEKSKETLIEHIQMFTRYY
ncbi:MAG: GntR family transcriptional regulator [Candidatus Frackibacter sp. T328-2]|nr:MAG: GntR family transcriptional regulator [Candidatus Frackibacter sp. T328-2]